jgi:hypothetical protein
MSDIKELVRRHDKLWERMLLWRPIWQDLADYLIPRKADVHRTNTWGPRKQTDKMFDETGPQAAADLAATMQGNLTSPSAKWFGLTLRDKALRIEQEWQKWLEDCADAIYSAFQNSNLSEQIQEGYLDEVVFGITSLLMEEKTPSFREFSGFRFETLALGSFAVDEDAEGMVDCLHREFRLSARAIVDRWPMAQWEGDGVVQARTSFESIIRNDPFRMVDVAHCVSPRHDYDEDDREGRRPQKEKQYENYYFLKAEKVVLEEGGYDDFPFMVPRWAKQAGEIYGRGPGLLAYPSVRTLNRAIEMDFKHWAKSLDPPMNVKDRGVIGRVKTGAGAVNIVRDMDAVRPTFERDRAPYQPTQIRVERLETKIKRCFFTDQFQLPGGGPSPGSQNTYMTATETEKRYELMQQLLGPTLGRLKHELHKPMVERAFRMMAKRKALPEPPESFIAAYEGSRQLPHMDVVYEGPLERAQRASSLQSINRAWAISVPVLQAKPDAIDVIDGDALVREIFEAAGTPSGILLDQRKVKQTRQARAQAQAQEADRVRMMEMAQAAGQAAPAMKAMGQNGTAAPAAA